MIGTSQGVSLLVACLPLAIGTGLYPQQTPAQDGDSRIAFVSNRDGNAEIYVMNIDGTHPVRLTNSASGDPDAERGVSNSNPAWSPH